MSLSSIDRQDLRTAVRALEPLADNRSALIYRTAVEVSGRRGRIDLRVSDGESEVLVRIKKTAGQDFDLLIPTKVFRRALDAFDDQKISLGKKDSDLLLTNNQSRHLDLATIDNSRLPDPLDSGQKIASGKVRGADLARALGQAIRVAQSADQSRPIICSVALQKLHFLDRDYLNIVATDGHRLLEAPIELAESAGDIFQDGFVWPLGSIKALAHELARASKEDPDLLVEVRDWEKIAEFSFRDRSWRSTGLAGSYPDTKTIFQNARGENLLYFDRPEMIQTLKSLGSIASGDSPVVLGLDGQLGLDYHVPGVARFQERIDQSLYQGKGQEVAFNHQYLQELCQLISGEKFSEDLNSTDQIKARVPDEAQAVLFYGDQFVRVLLMPIRR